MRRLAKQSSVLSPAIFNNAIRCATRRIPHFLIEPSIDASHLSYADDILLLSDNLQSLQAAVNSLYAGLSDIGLSVASAKTEFLVFGCHHPPDSKIQVGPDSISATASLKYLGLAFGTSIRTTRSLTINVLREKLRKSYGRFSRVKGQFDKKTLGQLYNSFFAPHVFFLVPLWKFFTTSERQQIRSVFFKFCKYFLRVPIWSRNSYISKRYGVFEICDKMDVLEGRFRQRSESVVDFPLGCINRL